MNRNDIARSIANDLLINDAAIEEYVDFIYGTLVVNYAKTAVSENFPELWLFAMGALFIGVVMLFPRGLSGLYNDYIEEHLLKIVKFVFTPENEESAKKIPFGKKVYKKSIDRKKPLW